MLKEYFLNRIKEKCPNNFNKYNYSLVPNEFKARDKVNIICNKHGKWEQTPDNHLHKYGCPKCATEYVISLKRSNRDVFIKKAKQVHNDKYNYVKVVYINIDTKVIIGCPDHGDFEQIAYDHLSGKGCPSCALIKKANAKRSTKEQFTIKANKIHGDKYTYILDYYNGNNGNKIPINCSRHGSFLQKPSEHLQGQGCPICRESFGEKFIAQILDKLNIRFVREYKILGYNYKYDFYLPEYDIYIEYHGIQHYKPIKWFGGNKSFNKQQKRDKTKVELVKRSNGLLIVIKYTFRTLQKIEDELIRLFMYIHPQFFIDIELTKQAIINSHIYLIDDGISYKRK